jgi:hypothetical protein
VLGERSYHDRRADLGMGRVRGVHGGAMTNHFGTHEPYNDSAAVLQAVELSFVRRWLETDDQFFRDWCYSGDGARVPTDEERRDAIARAVSRGMNNRTVRLGDREQLRRYFMQLFYGRMPPDKPSVRARRLKTFDTIMEETARAALSLPPETSTPQPIEEIDMTLTFTTTHKLNDIDIKSLSKARIYEAIHAEEKRIDTLNLIRRKPKSLVLEIKEANDKLAEFVAFLDAQ